MLTFPKEIVCRLSTNKDCLGKYKKIFPTFFPSWQTGSCTAVYKKAHFLFSSWRSLRMNTDPAHPMPHPSYYSRFSVRFSRMVKISVKVLGIVCCESQLTIPTWSCSRNFFFFQLCITWTIILLSNGWRLLLFFSNCEGCIKKMLFPKQSIYNTVLKIRHNTWPKW